MATGSHQPPQPAQSRREQVHHAENAVVRIFPGGGRSANPETPDVDLYFPGYGVFHMTPGHDYPGIGAGFSRGIHGVLPDQGGSPGLAVYIQENEGFRRIDAQLLQVRFLAVLVEVVDPEEPAVLGVGDCQFSVLGGMGHRHVVRHGMQFAGIVQFEEEIVFGNGIVRQQDATVGFTMDGLGHFALAAAACAFVENDELVVIRSDEPHRGTVQGGPSLLLADIQQNAVDAFLRARSGIQVVAKQFMAFAQAIMDHYLFSAEVGMPERRGYIQNRPGRESFGDLRCGDKSLEIRQSSHEEAGIRRRDKQRRVAAGVVSAPERQGHQFSQALEPFERFGPDRIEILTVSAAKAFLVAGIVVRDQHRFRIPTAHIGLGVVHRRSVFTPGHRCFEHLALSGNIVTDLEHIGSALEGQSSSSCRLSGMITWFESRISCSSGARRNRDTWFWAHEVSMVRV
jgi:hypothetical protein